MYMNIYIYIYVYIYKFTYTILLAYTYIHMYTYRPEGVNRPDLLPKEMNVPLIDVANFLSKSEEKTVLA
jgi:hypothetical protein